MCPHLQHCVNLFWRNGAELEMDHKDAKVGKEKQF